VRRLTKSQLSDLLLSLYEASGDPVHWQVFLARLTELTGADNAGIVLHNISAARTEAFEQHGLDPHGTQQYLQYYSAINPWLPQSDAQPSDGPIVRGETIVPPSKLRKTEFYADWARKNDSVFSMVATLRIGGGEFLYTYMNRGEKKGAHTAGSEELLVLMLPHLRRALEHRRHFERAAVLRHAVDDLSAAIFVIDAQRHVVDMSRRAEECVRERRLLVISKSGKLDAPTPDITRELDACLTQMLRNAFPRNMAIALVTDGSQPAYAVLTRHDIRLGAFQPGPLFVLTLIEPAVTSTPKAEALARMFGLTQAEFRLVTTLVSTGSLDLAIERLGITRNTARTQMSAIFQKTGTKRQGQIIQLFS
jgi:DNA-binding CsgD family transcriptional regulator